MNCMLRPAALLMCLALSACARVEAPTPTPATEHYRLVADGAAYPLMRALSDAYTETVNPYLLFTLESGSPALVAERVQSGQVPVGATSLIPPNAVASRWWLADLATDGVVVVTHADNPIGQLALRDLRDIFSGVRNSWADYGEATLGNIEVAVREDGDGTRVIFDRTVMGDQRLTFDALVMPSVETMLNFVAIKPGAIGYVPYSSVVQHQARAGRPAVNLLALDGIEPTSDNLADGDYPLVHTLHLIGLQEPRGELRNFIAWALGPQGRAIAQSLGYATGP